MEWSPTRRDLLRAAGVGAPTAGFGNVSWDDATDAVPDHPFAPTAETRWQVDVGETAIPIEATADAVYVVTREAVAELSTDGTRRWRFGVETDEPENRPRAAVAAGSVYVGNHETLWALDAAEGTVRWRFDGRRYPVVRWTTPDTVFVDGMDGVAALSPADGSERWEFAPERGGVWLGSVHADGWVYLGTSHGGLYALAESDGRVRWRTTFSEESDNEYPHVQVLGHADDRLVASNSGEGTVYGLDRESGRRTWTVRTGVESTGFPGTMEDGTVYLNDGSTLRAFSATEGTERWRYGFGRELDWSPTAVGDTVYVGATGRIAAVDPDGTERWTFATGDEANAYCVGALDDAVAVHSHETAVYALAPSDGRLRWTYVYPDDLTWLPQVVDDAAYVATESGTVYALSSPGSTPVSDAARTLASPAGFAVGGLLGGALAVGAYRRRGRGERDEEGSADGSAPDGLTAPTEFADFELLGARAGTDGVEVRDARTPSGERVVLRRFDPEAVPAERFAGAVETWADLDARGVLDVRWWGTDPAPWVATEYADATLAERAPDPSTVELGRALADTAETLHRAHREGVVHGGPDAGNVWLSDGDVLVGDWRLAAECDDAAVRSPEPDADPATVDTYRLAALADDLLGDDRPDDLREVVSRALADDPADRYDSALKFADALRWAVRE